MVPKTDLVAMLKKLRLSGFLSTLDLRVQEAFDQSLSPAELLERLLTDQRGRLYGPPLAALLRRARA